MHESNAYRGGRDVRFIQIITFDSTKRITIKFATDNDLYLEA